MRSTKQINVENRPCYFFNVTQIILQFLIQVLCIDKLSFKSTDIIIYNIRYITMKSLDHVNTDSANPLNLFLIMFMVTFKKLMEINTWILLLQTKTESIRKSFQIETINGGQQIKFKKDFIKIRFESDNDFYIWVKY